MVIKPPQPTSNDNSKQQSIVDFGKKTKFRVCSKQLVKQDIEQSYATGAGAAAVETKPITNPINDTKPIADTSPVPNNTPITDTSPNTTPITDTLDSLPIIDTKPATDTTPDIKQNHVKILLETNVRKKKNKKQSVKEDKEPAQKLTDFYQIRRSSRQPRSKIKDQEYQIVVEKVKRKCQDDLEVRNIVEKGRGVFSKRAFIRKEFVVEYSGKLITFEEAKQKEMEYSQHPEYGCYMYYFQFKNKKYCIDGTAEDGSLGRLLNHSINGNVESKVVNIENKPVLLLVAKKDIPADTELCYDYGERSRDIIKSYPWLTL